MVPRNEPKISIPDHLHWDHNVEVCIRYTDENFILSNPIWADLIRKSGVMGLSIPDSISTHVRFERELLRTIKQNEVSDTIAKVTILSNQHYCIQLFHPTTSFWETKKEGWWSEVKSFPDLLHLPYWYRHQKIWSSMNAMASDMGYDLLFILDHQKHIIETSRGGFFIVKAKKTTYIGDLKHINSISSQVVRNYIKEVTVRSFISEEELLQSDEIFILDNANGLQWILAMGQRRFFSITSKNIFRWLYEHHR
ncbi:hypothetical protein K5X82_09095 [Halosquirtibacter xylanolyticus]|uniref:hypothetical protein n=1 Tax=Halosquirtibacter xylanolyticus TaxID=3374599 RepID=UPI0037480109|nr:hypothetical protein K5X82_09095 [Prolixibacteraceae bacterium]